MKLLLSLSLFLTSITAFGQTPTKVLEAVINSVNTKSSEPLESYLDPGFSIAGHEGDMAQKILAQVFIQLNDSVINYELTDSNRDRLKADIQYARLGIREATLTFSESGSLLSMELFPMEVKTSHGSAPKTDTTPGTREIPFEMAGNLIKVDVEVNGKLLPFLLDTGAPRVIMNKKYFKSESGEDSTPLKHRGVNGDIDNVDLVGIESLNFAGIRMENQEFLAMDLQHLERELGTSFYGLIGYNLVSQFDLLFDYKNKRLILLTPGSWPTGWSSNNSTTIPIKMNGHIPVINIEVDGRTYAMGIDSGAESNLFDDDLFDNLRKSVKNPRNDQLNGADKTAREIRKGEINLMVVGDLTFRDQTAVFSDISHLNEGYSLELDGIVGYQILSVYPTILRFGSEELVFQSL